MPNSFPRISSFTAGKRTSWSDKFSPYLFISPFLIFFLVFFLGPSVYSFALSFYKYAGYGSAQFVGLRNYIAILLYPTFWMEIRNVVFYWIAHAVPMMAIAFFLALLINSKVVPLKRFFKPVLFVPQLIATVAAGLLFQNFFGTQYGILNSLLGLEIPWLQDMVLAKWTTVFMLIWRGTGYWIVIFLAGMTSINPEMNEAAIVDGANTWQRLILITIPLMRNTFLFAFVVDAIVTLRLFTEPNILGGRAGMLAPPEMAPVLNLVVQNLQHAQFGRSSAVGWLLFILIAVVSLVQFRLLQDKE